MPISGPAILAGNHVAVLEIVMMAVYSKNVVEFLGTGDIPLDPKFAWLANLYGLIPIRRGTVDREGIKTALGVLKQGGVLGVFPQGGIWDTSVSSTRIGAALLSQMGKAPVIPIGFGGMQGALRKVLRLKRPRLVMNVGKPIDYGDSWNNGRPDRQKLEQHAGLIIQRIFGLLPEDEKPSIMPIQSESYDIEISFVSSEGINSPYSPPQVSSASRAALGQLFHFPILLDALERNLKLPVESLRNLDRQIDPAALVRACQSILDYLQKNPGFFTYRFGVARGLEVEAGLRELMAAMNGIKRNFVRVKIVPIYRYRDSDRGEIVEERELRKVHSM